MPATRDLAAELRKCIRMAGTPERAGGSKAYLKSDLDFYGATVPDVRRCVRSLPGPTDRRNLLELVGLLWAEPVFELRLAAALLLTQASGLLRASDLGLLARLIRQSRTWALVDVLAGDAAGPLIARLESGPPGARADLTPVLDAWAADDDFWLRRSALLAHLVPLRLPSGGGDWDRFTRYADAMLGEREFFVRKAIGWVLRDTSKRRPELVRSWVGPRLDRMSGVTRREAVKYL